MFKSLIIRFFLKKEVDALKSRLAEASDALKRIEAAAVGLPKDAPASVHAFGANVLKLVLNSADTIRIKNEFTHDWERALYEFLHAGKYPSSTIVWAHKLVDETKLFFRK